jgi:hypothetical protein
MPSKLAGLGRDRNQQRKERYRKPRGSRFPESCELYSRCPFRTMCTRYRDALVPSRKRNSPQSRRCDAGVTRLSFVPQQQPDESRRNILCRNAKCQPFKTIAKGVALPIAFQRHKMLQMVLLTTMNYRCALCPMKAVLSLSKLFC